MTLLSIIIPVYKVEQTLDRCIESVLAQTGVDMEIILVDDGSPDCCPHLCNEWAARDARITVVHKTNGGLSDARNMGMYYARGQFITFVDSDDYLEKDTYPKVLAAMDDDTDIIEFPVCRYGGPERQQHLTFSPKSYRDMTAYWLQERAYKHTYAWNKVYRRTLFDSVRFPVGRVFEDVVTLPCLLKLARKVQLTDQGLYFYCENSEGITANASGDDLRQLLSAHLDNWDVTQDDVYYLHVLNIQIDVCRLTGEAPLLSDKKIWHWRRLTMRQVVKALALNVMGVKGVCKLFSAL